jgi:uncharacterized protein
MLALLSPAKTLDLRSPVPTQDRTDPEFLDSANQLVEVLQKLRPKQLSELMSISDNLAQLNHARFADWSPLPEIGAAHPALFAFQGDVYRGFKAHELTVKQITYAQDHLRMLSGLYGVLRPLDRMQAYRLEMGTSLKTKAGKDLYAFWGSQITDSLNRQIRQTKSKFVLNLASQEYFKSVHASEFVCSVISPVFKEVKNGQSKLIALFAKIARGTMAAWVMKNKIKSPAKLIEFAEDGYRYDADTSTPQAPVFIRKSK